MATLKEELTEIEKQLDALNARKAEIYKRSETAPELEKVCPDWMARFMGGRQPVASRTERMYRGIHWSKCDVFDAYKGPRTRWVKIRPCSDGAEKTYLGIYIGDFALSLSVRLDEETAILNLAVAMYNPAIFVPDLGRVVFGMESWWGEIESPEQLQQIADADIENVWYVRALRDLADKTAPQP